MLHVADKDGGSHVDPKLDADYAEFSRKNSLGHFASSGTQWRPLLRPELATLRQIAHEILKTFVHGYSKKPQANLPGIQILGSGISVVEGVSAPMPRHPPKAQIKIGRNDKCPCGSGKKFKHCHGA